MIFERGLNLVDRLRELASAHDGTEVGTMMDRAAFVIEAKILEVDDLNATLEKFRNWSTIDLITPGKPPAA